MQNDQRVLGFLAIFAGGFLLFAVSGALILPLLAFFVGLYLLDYGLQQFGYPPLGNLFVRYWVELKRLFFR